MKYEIDGVNYEVVVTKKRIKNLYIRYKNNIIYVNIPFLIFKYDVVKLLDENIDSIRKMIKRDSKNKDNMFLGEEVDIISISNLKSPEYSNHKLYIKDKGKIDDAYKLLSEPIFRNRLDAMYHLFSENIPYPSLRIRKMTSRWGVCNRKTNTITLNLDLIKWEIPYIDYVIIHELSHFIHFNHSISFWNTVQKYCPSYKLIRKKLRE